MRDQPLPLRILRWIVILVLALALSFAILRIAVQDDSATDAPGSAGTTGRTTAAPGADSSATLLRDGNAVVTVPDDRAARQVRRLAAALGAEDRPAVRAAGQAVVIVVRPRAAGVVARVGDQRLGVRSAADPALRTFLADGLGG
ncbi:hypothetical protein PAI11_41870 [Patulibacter medicamentivorans]|uniref:Uncharacterized protein n=1 Tax=Patulibacter medicamentivorans TaxID=1097667 RepID=H0EBF8_9ACTN|nr:hypothetical protein [Patulibacter medicamentivorans]EHN09034.1 hypothetical protein PAI11_41870 [Patulibacter medicamentivorans]